MPQVALKSNVWARQCTWFIAFSLSYYYVYTHLLIVVELYARDRAFVCLFVLQLIAEVIND